jgi:CRISPR-associated protein Cas8a1/Csx13
MADENELTWRLSDPGMDILERAGLAGLFMTLKAAGEKPHDLSPLSWELASDAVTLRWSGPAQVGFEKLMRWAWQVTKDGVLYLPGVQEDTERANFHLRVPTHTGLMRTFWQHPNVQPRGELIEKIVRVDEGREISVSYRPPSIRPGKTKDGAEGSSAADPKKLLKPAKDVAVLFDRNGALRTAAVELSNWVYPGIAGRYADEKAWAGMPDRAFLLMLAPAVCLFQRLQGEGGNWVFVIPDVRDLEEFSIARRQMKLNADFVDVASLGDAGLKFFAQYSSTNPRRWLAGCRVVAMGIAGYYHKGQSIRKAVLDVTADKHQVDRYRLLHQHLPNKYNARRPDEAKASPAATGKRAAKAKKAAKEEPRKAAGFFKLPAARGRIADNLVNSRPWYENLTVPMTWDRDELERQRKRNKERNDVDGGRRPTSPVAILFDSLQQQEGSLMKLIQDDAMWDTEAEKVFVEAFWETLRALYRREADAAKERGGSRTPSDRMEDLNEKLRRALSQAKTNALLRQLLTEFYARPVKKYRSPTLGKYSATIWRLVDADWKKGRDLALLALASYMSEGKRTLASQTEGV